MLGLRREKKRSLAVVQQTTNLQESAQVNTEFIYLASMNTSTQFFE